MEYTTTDNSYENNSELPDVSRIISKPNASTASLMTATSTYSSVTTATSTFPPMATTSSSLSTNYSLDGHVDSSSTSCYEKVPVIRHDMSRCDWEAVARIYIYSCRIGYQPLYISQVFLISTLFGEDNVDDTILKFSFKQYISTDVKQTLDSMLENFDLSNMDPLLEVLSAYNCFRVPTESNLNELVKEIAHQELIQRPRYISNCFFDFAQHLEVLFPSVNELTNIYKKFVPTTRKVLQCITVASEMTDKQRLVLDYLKRYIKTLESKELCRFLRFVTGGNNVLSGGIYLVFSSQEGRAPRSHTCVSQLELSDEYTQYADFADEFANVLLSEDSFRFSII